MSLFLLFVYVSGLLDKMLISNHMKPMSFVAWFSEKPRRFKINNMNYTLFMTYMPRKPSWQKPCSYFHPISLQLRITQSLEILGTQCWKDIHSLSPQGYSSMGIMGRPFFFLNLFKYLSVSKFNTVPMAVCTDSKSTKNIPVKSLLLCFLWSAKRILKSPCTWNLTAALRVSELAQKGESRESWNLKPSVKTTNLSSHQKV